MITLLIPKLMTLTVILRLHLPFYIFPSYLYYNTYSFGSGKGPIVTMILDSFFYIIELDWMLN